MPIWDWDLPMRREVITLGQLTTTTALFGLDGTTMKPTINGVYRIWLKDAMTGPLMTSPRPSNLNPNEVSYHMKLGKIHDRLGQPQFSEWSYSRAISLDNFSADAYYQRGLARRQLGRFDARFDFEEAARLYRSQENWSAGSRALQQSFRSGPPIRPRPYDPFYNPYRNPSAGQRFFLPYDPPSIQLPLAHLGKLHGQLTITLIHLALIPGVARF